MSRHVLDFEKPVAELDSRIDELRHLTEGGEGVNITEEVIRLERKRDGQLRSLYSKITPHQKVQVARHPERPHGARFVATLIRDFTELAGDRCFGDDAAILGGMGFLGDHACVVLAQERGHDTESRLKHNFGMAKPEGYRKAQRLMQLAERFGLPVVTFVDTAGAFPGVEAEARGQAEAIARAIDISLGLRVPIVAAIIGEGGSGGAVALATGDSILMAEHAVYSVISPEGCASILWRNSGDAASAAAALRLTAQDLHALGVIDAVIPEPLGGAHRDPEACIAAFGQSITAALESLLPLDPQTLLERRRMRFIAMGSKGLAG